MKLILAGSDAPFFFMTVMNTDHKITTIYTAIRMVL